MTVAAVLTAPAMAQPVSGAVKVSFADIFGWWLPVAATQPRPAVIALHGCDGLYLRNPLNARERSVAELLGRRGFHVLLSDSCRGANIHDAVDWLAARPEVDRTRIVVLGWSTGGDALLAALKHRIGPMPLQARAAIAFSPSCGPYAVTPGSYLPVAPLLILVGSLDERTPAAACLELANWTPKVVVRVLPESGDGMEAILAFLERELR
jgi:dienelactone hydrolase